MERCIPVTESGCWLWVGSVDGDGYGFISPYINGERIRLRAHRASYEVFVGEIPDGMFVCHKCDVPGCVNPDHLFAGSALDNTRDMIQKGRDGYRKKETHCTKGHEITPDNITITGRCRICNKVRANKRYAKVRDKGPRSNLSKSGLTGVGYKAFVDRWIAQISINNERIHLGTFRCSLDAYAARRSAEIRYAEAIAKEYQKNS